MWFLFIFLWKLGSLGIFFKSVSQFCLVFWKMSDHFLCPFFFTEDCFAVIVFLKILGISLHLLCKICSYSISFFFTLLIISFWCDQLWSPCKQPVCSENAGIRQWASVSLVPAGKCILWSGPKVLRESCAACPRPLEESWIRDGAAGTQTCTTMRSWHCRLWLPLATLSYPCIVQPWYYYFLNFLELL